MCVVEGVTRVADGGHGTTLEPVEVKELRREIRQLRSAYESVKRRLDLAVDADCRTCRGRGSVDGFLLGTLKRCPACNGSGLRGARV